MPTLDVDGLRLHFTDTVGAGTPIVLVPGGLGSSDTWLVVAKDLAARHRVLVVDLHGAGRTAPWPHAAPMTLDDEAALVLEVISARCGEPVVLVGHSYGAGVALRVVVRKPALVGSVVLVEPFVLEPVNRAGEPALYAQARGGFDAFTDAYDRGDIEGAVRAWFTAYMPVPWADLPPVIRSKLAASVEAIRSGNRALLADPTGPTELARIKRRTLIVSGGNSLPVFRQIANVLARLVPGAHQEVIPGGSHLLYEKRPKELAAVIAAFVAGTADAPGPPAAKPTPSRIRELRSTHPLTVYEHDPLVGDRFVGSARDGVAIRPGVRWFVRHADPDLAAPHVPALVRELVERGVTGVGFAGNRRIDDTALAALAPLAPTLEVLELAGTGVGDVGLARLASLPALRVLDLGGTAITRRAAEWLSTLHTLEHLRLGWTDIGDATLARIASLPALRTLDLTATAITASGLAALARLPLLEALGLAETATTDDGIAALGGRALRHLDLAYTRVTEACLSRLERVETVVVRATAIGRHVRARPTLVF